VDCYSTHHFGDPPKYLQGVAPQLGLLVHKETIVKKKLHIYINQYSSIFINIHLYITVIICKPIFTNFAKTLGHLFGGGPQAPGVQRPSRATAAQRFFGLVGMMVGMTMFG
jgi:hypothetical protein